MDTTQEQLYGLVRERAQEQASAHWSELSAIIAGANIVGALVLSGTILTENLPTSTRLLGAVIAIAAMIASFLAYFSIQVARLVLTGPLSLSAVVASFALAGAQLAMFMWPIHVLRQDGIHRNAQYVNSLRHWLVFLALFASSAAYANYSAAKRRRVSEQTVASALSAFEAGQKRDRRGASVSAVVALIAWAVASLDFTYWITLSAVVITAFAMTVALVQQETSIRSLWPD